MANVNEDGYMDRAAHAIIDGREPHEKVNIARCLEDEIERRGLQEQYMIALLGEGGSYLLSLSVAWELLRATPEQRARAFLEATK